MSGTVTIRSVPPLPIDAKCAPLSGQSIHSQKKLQYRVEKKIWEVSLSKRFYISHYSLPLVVEATLISDGIVYELYTHAKYEI